jgi:hypothetical protein
MERIREHRGAEPAINRVAISPSRPSPSPSIQRSWRRVRRARHPGFAPPPVQHFGPVTRPRLLARSRGDGRACDASSIAGESGRATAGWGRHVHRPGRGGGALAAPFRDATSLRCVDDTPAAAGRNVSLHHVRDSWVSAPWPAIELSATASDPPLGCSRPIGRRGRDGAVQRWTGTPWHCRRARIPASSPSLGGWDRRTVPCRPGGPSALWLEGVDALAWRVLGERGRRLTAPGGGERPPGCEPVRPSRSPPSPIAHSAGAA